MTTRYFCDVCAGEMPRPDISHYREQVYPCLLPGFEEPLQITVRLEVTRRCDTNGQVFEFTNREPPLVCVDCMKDILTLGHEPKDFRREE